MKVKIFEGILQLPPGARDGGFLSLDDKVNAFLEDNEDIKIKFIKQSSATTGDSEWMTATTIISIWYEK
ncbi:hypothetical protein ACYSNU_16705 [Enterococcus sp. LJL120]